jgi:hypothetical protein
VARSFRSCRQGLDDEFRGGIERLRQEHTRDHLVAEAVAEGGPADEEPHRDARAHQCAGGAAERGEAAAGRGREAHAGRARPLDGREQIRGRYIRAQIDGLESAAAQEQRKGQ